MHMPVRNSNITRSHFRMHLINLNHIGFLLADLDPVSHLPIASAPHLIYSAVESIYLPLPDLHNTVLGCSTNPGAHDPATRPTFYSHTLLSSFLLYRPDSSTSLLCGHLSSQAHHYFNNPCH
ncbi:Uncharacterized protein HZ326_20387 [Fusarium oxysporum f. sp. albedinis]|nr:Uncharacterized protein HZ326_20387 [Fusarium oxysporum f. sp. albedinis]